jgi:hypothetical protein
MYTKIIVNMQEQLGSHMTVQEMYNSKDYYLHPLPDAGNTS